VKTRPVTPARITWDTDGTPMAADAGDVYRPRSGALDQARQVFLAGNGLPARWAGRDDFTIAETGFGLGHNFVATWQAWRDDAQRPTRLHYVAVETHPPQRADLLRAWPDHDLADQLVQAWPPAVSGLHTLHFDGGRVRLLLALGDVRIVLPELSFAADAFYLDGFAPVVNPEMWDERVLKALGRRARHGATAATWCVARSVRDGLAAAGFDSERVPGNGGKREVLHARFAPRFPVKARPTIEERQALVLGAGLAGACTAAALAGAGLDVQVLDRHPQPAAGSSGNPAGLYHATVHRDDGPHARLFRAAALHTARLLSTLDPSQVPHGQGGLLRLERDADLVAMQALLDRQQLPPDFVQAWPMARASDHAGVPLPASAWYYPGGGWVSPAALARQRLAQPGVRFTGGADVRALRRAGDHWQALGPDAQVLAQAPIVVLAVAEQVNPLLASLGAPAFALGRGRGQISHVAMAHGLQCAVAGDGYALPLPDGGLLCGATHHPGDDDTALRAVDHHANFTRLQRLTGISPPADPGQWQGRVGWRVQPPDRLPLAGPLPALQMPPGARHDRLALVPRERGLYVACGFGSRGITLAPLLGQVLAALIADQPLPLEQSLLDAVDPARWLVRASRRGGPT
jgi:tRNA 5-methylaminomethyl-2-thiouridine biosynthesis bifunctional protein